MRGRRDWEGLWFHVGAARRVEGCVRSVGIRGGCVTDGLVVNLKEKLPGDGYLYFTVNFIALLHFGSFEVLMNSE